MERKVSAFPSPAADLEAGDGMDSDTKTSVSEHKESGGDDDEETIQKKSVQPRLPTLTKSSPSDTMEVDHSGSSDPSLVDHASFMAHKMNMLVDNPESFFADLSSGSGSSSSGEWESDSEDTSSEDEAAV